MQEEPITFGTREQRRALVLTRVVAGDWTPVQAALALGLSERQVRRLVAAVRDGGPAALVHGTRGRAPANRLPAPLREQIVALAQTTYAGFNHQHLTEELAEVERLRAGRSTVRRVLLGAGLGSPRSRRAPKWIELGLAG
jgi:transposase